MCLVNPYAFKGPKSFKDLRSAVVLSSRLATSWASPTGVYGAGSMGESAAASLLELPGQMTPKIQELTAKMLSCA